MSNIKKKRETVRFSREIFSDQLEYLKNKALETGYTEAFILRTIIDDYIIREKSDKGGK